MKIENDGTRFYTKTEHGEAELSYRVIGEVISMYHTFTPDRDRGKGIAEKLADEAFAFAIKNNLKVRPDCSYIRHYLEVHSGMRKYAVQ
ncbi:MAG: N-acetyltransferase [Candidatus Micrarchaeota archaeon]|nr:N-acetyltransferase [Candidatus Micrarchaeota archaeon]MDE1804801.1 N-acetyltransferase [Candidatus Micrarchaeota archaeon]MDE1846880.1 N-acetyltransferase [Candidatus Micrarchaeota archaeon]